MRAARFSLLLCAGASLAAHARDGDFFNGPTLHATTIPLQLEYGIRPNELNFALQRCLITGDFVALPDGSKLQLTDFTDPRQTQTYADWLTLRPGAGVRYSKLLAPPAGDGGSDALAQSVLTRLFAQLVRRPLQRAARPQDEYELLRNLRVGPLDIELNRDPSALAGAHVWQMAGEVYRCAKAQCRGTFRVSQFADDRHDARLYVAYRVAELPSEVRAQLPASLREGADAQGRVTLSTPESFPYVTYDELVGDFLRDSAGRIVGFRSAIYLRGLSLVVPSSYAAGSPGLSLVNVRTGAPTPLTVNLADYANCLQRTLRR